MTSATTSFSLGLTYWPRRSGYSWWRSYDRGAVRDELAHVASFGCNVVRFCLLWEDFQPSPRRVGSAALRALEHALDAAGEQNLDVVCSLFPVAVGGALMLPSWANGANLLDELTGTGALGPSIVVPAPGALPILSEGAYRPNQARDLFSYQPIVSAQRYLIDEIVGYFGAHPAISAWQIGDGIERVRKPASIDAVAAWYTTMADAVRARRPGVPVLGVTSARGIQQLSGPRPEQIARACDLLGISAYPPEAPVEARRHTSFPLFLTTLAMALAQQPVLTTSLGLPTTALPGGEWRSERVYARQRMIFYADQEQQATFLEVALERLYQAGASGALLAGYADYGPEHWRTPPLDRAPFERTAGLVDAQGAEKQSVRAIQEFAQRIKASDTRPEPRIDGAIDPERYWHNPAPSFAELWADFDNDERSA